MLTPTRVAPGIDASFALVLAIFSKLGIIPASRQMFACDVTSMTLLPTAFPSSDPSNFDKERARGT